MHTHDLKTRVHAQGTVQYAAARLEAYHNSLESRLVARFDEAAEKGDLEGMAECTRVMAQFPRGEDILMQVKSVCVKDDFLTSRLCLTRRQSTSRRYGAVFGEGGKQ